MAKIYTVTGGRVKVGGEWAKPGEQVELNKAEASPLLKYGFVEPGEVEVIPEPAAPVIVPNEKPTPADTEAILCPDCDRVFPDEERLARHRTRSHKAAVAKEKKAAAKADEAAADGQAPAE